jgi:hypothetical protein
MSLCGLNSLTLPPPSVQCDRFVLTMSQIPRISQCAQALLHRATLPSTLAELRESIYAATGVAEVLAASVPLHLVSRYMCSNSETSTMVPWRAIAEVPVGRSALVALASRLVRTDDCRAAAALLCAPGAPEFVSLNKGVKLATARFISRLEAVAESISQISTEAASAGLISAPGMTPCSDSSRIHADAGDPTSSIDCFLRAIRCTYQEAVVALNAFILRFREAIIALHPAMGASPDGRSWLDVNISYDSHLAPVPSADIFATSTEKKAVEPLGAAISVPSATTCDGILSGLLVLVTSVRKAYAMNPQLFDTECRAMGISSGSFLTSAQVAGTPSASSSKASSSARRHPTVVTTSSLSRFH